MKFNIKIKYILFIILSFVFVMSGVDAATTVNIKELYPNAKNFQATNTSDGAKYFTLWQNTGGTRKAIAFFHGITSRRDDGTYELLCYDPCADPSTSYSAVTDNSEFAQKLSYLMNKTSVSEKYALGVAQMLGAIYKKNHCDSSDLTFPNSNINRSGGKKFNDVIKEYAHYCSSQNFVDDASLRNNEHYLQFDGRGLSSAQLCQLYNDVNKNYTKYKAQYSIKNPVVTSESKEENGEKITTYTVTVNINNSEAFINNFRSTFANLQSKAKVVPTGGNSFGDSLISAASWYSINNSKYKFISADLSANRLEVKLSIKGECSPATLTINDHGAVSSSGILQSSSGGSQYLAVRSSLFVTSARISCSNDNQTSSSRCSVTNPPEHNKQTCTTIPVYRKIAKLPGAQKKYYIRDCTKSVQTVYTLSFDNLVASPFSIRNMGFSSVQDFTFSDVGADCCQDYNDTSFRASLLNLDPNAASWQEAYNKWCLNKEQYCTYDPNTKSVYNAAIPIAYNGGNPLATAQYAFESLDCCEDYKNGSRGFGAIKDDLSWKNAYNTYCGGPKTEITTSTACINPAPNSQTKVDNKINNCCLDDTHSYVQEVQLNDLFDNTKTHEGVTYFEPLPTCEGSDLDVAKGQINNYCDYYCTERLDIEVPGSTSADSGRYFKFNEIDGHASPKVDGYRRCRVTIKYDQWYSEYKQKLNELVTLFNDWQQKKAMLKMYEDAKSSRVAKTRSYTITCEKCTTPSSSTCQSRCASYLGAGYNNCMSGCMTPSCDTTSVGATENYYEYNYPDTYFGKESISGSNANVNFGYSFAPSAEHVSKGAENHDSVTHDPSCPSGYHKIGSSAANYSAFSFDGTDSAESQARQAYQNKLQEIQTLQTQLNTCDRYLDDNYLYNLNPVVKFRYTQFFKNELGDPDSVITDVDYGDASCTTRKLDTASNAKDKIEGPTYSPNPGYTGVTNIAYSRLKNNLLLNQNPGLDNYTADMKFRYDKIYNTTCYWDNQSTYYTLVPSGASDTVQLTDNYTVHDRVYKVLLTSYDGIYETYWELENLGHEGRLQQYFDNPTDTLKNKNNGENVNANTCSGLSESDADMLGLSSTFTCTFKVTHKAITTGRCNPDSGHDITLNGNSCDDKAEGYQLFYFKVADPSNLFPDGNGEYGKNWSTDMINKVQSTDTYNPANETYKFVLTQGDMKLIKEYNDSRESEGGYSDFDFSCTCTDACVNCKSKFLEDYYSGTFYSGSGTFTPAGKKLNEIREKYGW